MIVTFPPDGRQEHVEPTTRVDHFAGGEVSSLGSAEHGDLVFLHLDGERIPAYVGQVQVRKLREERGVFRAVERC